jgi:hypothetical protein
MGTRADFYLGRGADAKWLGSTAYDGGPENHLWLLKAKTARQFVSVVNAHIRGDDAGTLPAQGWPWPWNDSHLTDHAYAFDKGVVYVTMYPIDADGKYAGATAPTCKVCDHRVDRWCKLDDVRKADLRFQRAYKAHKKRVTAFQAALARFDAGLRKTEPTPPPDFDDEGAAFQVPRLELSVFPDMRTRQSVTLGPRSGVLLLKGG